MECLRSITSLVHRHLPSAATFARLRTASTKFVRKLGLRGQSRSSTAMEHRKKFGRRGFDSHRSANFDGPLSLGYRKSSLEDERVRIPQHQAADEIQLSSCPSHQCV